MDIYDKLYVLSSFIIQVCLVIYFASRKWNFDFSMRWGWTIYALGLPAVLVSLVLIMGGKPWYLWIAGFLYAAWAGFGYYVDIARPIDWRTPPYLPVFLPYILLYLSSLMFYWWPMATIQRPFLLVYAALFVVSTILNITSHKMNLSLNTE